MKKTVLVLGTLLIILIVSFAFLGSGKHVNNITSDEAVKKVQEMLDDKSKETITNFETPKTEKIVCDMELAIYYLKKGVKLKGKTLYKITFNTTQDGLLGPMVFYVDASNGIIVGMDHRE